MGLQKDGKERVSFRQSWHGAPPKDDRNSIAQVGKSETSQRNLKTQSKNYLNGT